MKCHSATKHLFSSAEVESIQRTLIHWYHEEKRDLPWRAFDPSDRQRKAYAVWVSETMLQQTQVNTVKSYFERFMNKFPDVFTLAKATLDDVNELWAGLGYYRRAKFLHEGAKHVVEQLGGVIPETSKELQKLPGIGPYSAGAIASIAFGEEAPIVDGNVVRVVSRMRAIGGNPKATGAVKLHWKLADLLVKGSGDASALNQALMELGATVCTKTNPKCEACPVSSLCEAFQKKVPVENVEDIECSLCNDWVPEGEGVTMFPAKKQPTKKRNESQVMVLLEHTSELVLVKRPAKGLLAGLWEFPSRVLTSDTDGVDEESEAKDVLRHLGVKSEDVSVQRHLGEFSHTFSHIQQRNTVYWVSLKDSFDRSGFMGKFLSKDKIPGQGVCKAVHKALALLK